MQSEREKEKKKYSSRDSELTAEIKDVWMLTVSQIPFPLPRAASHEAADPSGFLHEVHGNPGVQNSQRQLKKYDSLAKSYILARTL